jgi:DNA-directed RNA polymerase specialized sigma24 family protein
VDAEAEGFAQFVEARQRALQRTAWLLTGDWALAEDLVQTALVRTWGSAVPPALAEPRLA